MRKLNSSKLLGIDYFSSEHDGRTIYIPGYCYMKQFDDKIRKVKVQSIEIESIKQDDDGYENVVYIEYSFVENRQVGVPQREMLELHKFWARPVPHCWNCPKMLNEEVMDYCQKCKWIFCPECDSCSRDCENPHWYKSFKVTDAVKETYEINIVQPEHATKPKIFCDVVVTSHFGTFVFEGYYNTETDCVYVEPKYVNTYIDKDGNEQKRSAVAMNYALHAHVLQAIDAILE